MKPIISFSALFFLFSIATFSQITAVTETGEQVFLYEDGTWKWENEERNVEKPSTISVNEAVFGKPKASTFLVKSKKTKFGFWLDPKKWKFTNQGDNESAEYQFQLKGEDLYGMAIVERMEIPLVQLKDVAINNAINVAPDLKVTKTEYRFVNDLQVLHMQMEGTIQGMQFVYYGYYYSNAGGTVQLITYTSKNLFDTYKPVSEDFLNGLIVLP